MPMSERVEVNVIACATDSTGGHNFSYWQAESVPRISEDWLAAFATGADRVVVDGANYRKISDVATNSKPCYAYRKLVYERI